MSLPIPNALEVTVSFCPAENGECIAGFRSSPAPQEDDESRLSQTPTGICVLVPFSATLGPKVNSRPSQRALRRKEKMKKFSLRSGRAQAGQGDGRKTWPSLTLPLATRKGTEQHCKQGTIQNTAIAHYYGSSWDERERHRNPEDQDCLHMGST